MSDRKAALRTWSFARAWLVIFLIALPFSIAAAQIALTLAGAATVLALVLERRRPPALPLWVPWSAFMVVSLLSIACSLDSTRSLKELRTLVLVASLYLPVVLARTPEQLGRWIRLACGAGAALAVIALMEYLRGPGGLEGRLSGFHHWLTTAGQLMILLLLVLARLWFGPPRARPAWLVAASLLALALAFSFARSAWLGLTAGIGCLLWRRRSWKAAAPLAAAGLLLLAVPALRARLAGLADVDDPSVRNRLAQFVSGLDMVRDHPWLGVGPNMAGWIYPDYRRDWAPEPLAPHLHNTPLMVAAERGLLGLAAWLCWMTLAGAAFVRRLGQKGGSRWWLEGGLAALVAFWIAGLFEYNFGDSEVLMLVYFCLALPFVPPAPAERPAFDS